MVPTELKNVSRLFNKNNQTAKESLYVLVFVWSRKSEAGQSYSL